MKSIYLKFKLSMPNNNSWDGKWSGEGRNYTIVSKFPGSDISRERVNKILDAGYFHYSFGDGWAAGVNVEEIDRASSAKARKASNGFCGYDWMVDSIIANNDIRC